MKTTLIVSFAPWVMLSCSDDDAMARPACGVGNPAKELSWLKTEIDTREANITEDTKYCCSTQGEYDGRTVFVYWDCNPFIDKNIPILDCDGNILSGTPENPISLNDLENQMVIWRPVVFICEPEPYSGPLQT